MRNFSLGRSLVEMLAVLGIIGVLSVGSVALYRRAINKHTSTVILNDVIVRSKSVLSSDPNYRYKYLKDKNYEWLFGGLPNNGKEGQNGLEMHTTVSNNPNYIYMVTVKKVKRKACEYILEMDPEIDAIAANGHTFNKTASNEADVCSKDENDMTFYFDKK